MAVIETWLKTDLKSIVKVNMFHGILFSQDNMANLIGVELLDGGEPATVTGSVSANVLRADGTTVAVAGTLSGNKASVTLPQAAYAVPGMLAIVIKLTDSSTVTTIGAIQSIVYRASTDTIIDPGTIIPSVQDLIAAIEDAVESIPPDYSELTGEVSDLKTAITNNGGKIRYGFLMVDGEFSRNSLYHGALANNYNYRVATREIHSYPYDVTFDVSSGFKYLFNFFKSDGTTFDVASSWLTGEYTVPANKSWRMMIARVTENTSEVADIELFRSQVSTDTLFIKKIKENKEAIDEITNEVDVSFDYSYQFFDANQWNADKYWYNSSGNISMSTATSGSNYYAYPEIEIPAGTYYLSYTPGNFSFVKGKTSGNISNISDVVSSGKMTLTEDSIIYFTAYNRTLNTVMLANDLVPQTYKYGVYKANPLFPTIGEMGILNGTNKIVTVGVTGDYQSIQSACDNADVDDVILVLPGIYTEQISIFGKKLHIIGFDKKLCTIIDHSADYDTPPIEMNIGTLANLTIIEDGSNPTPDLSVGKDHLSYCIHNDNGTNTNGETLEIVNCDMRNDVHACIGFGMYANYTVKIRNCTMRSNAVKDSTYKRGALYFHANSGTNITGQKFIVENCIISCADTLVMYAGVPGGGSGEMLVRFTNNALWSDINCATNDAVSMSTSATFVLDNNSCGNNIQKINSMMPVIGSTNSVTVNSSSSAVVNNQKNRIKPGHIYEYFAVSEDGSSYSTGFMYYISTETAIVTVEVKNASCNVTASYSNGEIRVWNRDASNQHTYTLFAKMIA